jgi:hypothetical protein
VERQCREVEKYFDLGIYWDERSQDYVYHLFNKRYGPGDTRPLSDEEAKELALIVDEYKAEMALMRAQRYARIGEKLRQATQILKAAQHCKRCGYQFAGLLTPAGNQIRADRELCTDGCGDEFCVNQQSKARQSKSRGTRGSGASENTAALPPPAGHASLNGHATAVKAPPGRRS